MKRDFSTPGFLWPLLTIICVGVILYGLNRALKNTEWTKLKGRWVFFGTAIIIVLWIAIVTILSYRGFFSNFNSIPPRPALAILTPLPFVLLFAFSKTGTQLLRRTPSHWLVFMQSFRIFVELLIWFAYLANKLPIQMSFEGRNYDLLTGILALPTGYFLFKGKKYATNVAIAFNILGMLLLINILVVALLSMPTSFRYFMNEPSAILVGQFPFILLPGVLVPIAYSFNILSLRQLFVKKNNEAITKNH